MSRDKSKMGYRDDSPYRNEEYIDINTPNGIIDMSNTGIPLMANGRVLPPYSGEHQFDSNVVREVPLAQEGGDMHQMPDGTWMPGASHEYEYLELDEDEIEEYRRGGYVVEYQDGGTYNKVKETLRPANSLLLDLEKSVDRRLGYPSKRAVEYAKGYAKPGEASVDNIRHATSGLKTAQAIEDGTGNIPYLSKGLGFLGANALGLAHEATNINTSQGWYGGLKEAGEDMYNNAFGAYQNFKDVPDEKKLATISNASLNKTIPDGKYAEGGNIEKTEHGWDYKKDGDNYLTKKSDSTEWITATKPDTINAIKSKVFKEEVPGYTPQPTEAQELQSNLIKNKYNIGTADGIVGPKTKGAMKAFEQGVTATEYNENPDKWNSSFKPVKKAPQTNDFKVNGNLKDGFLPTKFYGIGDNEVCRPGSGCAGNVHQKVSNLMSGLIDDKDSKEKGLWGQNAWFQKDSILKSGGKLLWEDSSANKKSTDANKANKDAGKIPPELWSKLQVGDYVSLNRKDTGTSLKFKGKSDERFQNEGIEHLGVIVGMDPDGKPLVYHADALSKNAEDQVGWVQRIDEPLNLKGHAGLGDYNISSIYRHPKLLNIDKEKLEGLQNNSYYTAIDENKKLVATDNATTAEKQAVQIVNDSIGDFKGLGYSQDDINMVGKLLAGGIMESESSGAADPLDRVEDIASQEGLTSFVTNIGRKAKLVGKEGLARLGKDANPFHSGEASRGVYRLKDEMQFYDTKGNLNAKGKKLKKLGINPDGIFNEFQDDLDKQTKAGMVMLLDYYQKLKKEEQFDTETGLYKGYIPASYILAKQWNGGQGWYKDGSKHKSRPFLEKLDVTYSDEVLKNANKNVQITGGDSLVTDLEHINKIRGNYTEAKPEATAEEKAEIQNARKFFEQNPDYFNFEPDYTSQSSSTQIAPVESLPLVVDKTNRTRLAEEERKQEEFQSSKKRPGAYQFEDGGQSIEIELDDEAIAHYRKLGYKVDEI